MAKVKVDLTKPIVTKLAKKRAIIGGMESKSAEGKHQVDKTYKSRQSTGVVRAAAVKVKTVVDGKARVIKIQPATGARGQQVIIYKSSRVRNGVLAYTQIDSITLPALLAAIASTGNLTLSCEHLNISRLQTYALMQEDPDVKRRVEEAQEIGVKGWEDEAARRAFRGWERPIYAQGVQVGAETMYSDQLAMFMLRGAVSGKYRERVDNTHRMGPAEPGDETYIDRSDAELDELVNKKILQLEAVGEARGKGSMTVDEG